MPIRINCPACKTPNNVADDKRGRKVRCRKCEKIFSVPDAVGKSKPDEDEAIQDGRKVKAAGPRKQPNDDDDDADRQQKKSKKAPPAKRGVGMLLLGGGVAAVLLVCVVGIGGVASIFIFKGKPVEANGRQVQAEADIKNAAPENKGPIENLVKNSEPNKDKPAVDPSAGKPLPDIMAQDTVAKVKQATVYLRVTMPGGQIAEGSGFFAVEPGIIVTNAHVLGMLSASSKAPTQVDVVQDSGLPTETKMVGQILGVDRDSDLAVVRVPNNGKLPAALTLANAPPTELQRVYIFGFPFGESLGKNLTINEQKITSLRPDVKGTGALGKIQVDGGMNPGNSGGPVTNTAGNLVGVSVSIITGAQISFAVPAEKVRQVMEGRVAHHQYGEAYQQQGQARMPIKLTCLDPLNQIRQLRVEVWTGLPGDPRPTAQQKPPGQPGDGPKTEHVVTYADGLGALEVPLPALPPGQVYWFQPLVTSAKGTHWAPAHPTAVDVIPLEQKAANLTIDLDKAKERTCKMDSKVTVTESFGKSERKIVHHTTLELLEVLQETAVKDGKKTVPIKSAYGPMNIRFNVNGKDLKFDRDDMDALNISRTQPPSFIIDDTNGIVTFFTVSLNPKHPRYLLQDLVRTFNGFAQNPLEATQFKMPNRTVQPQETFPSQSTMAIRKGGGGVATPKAKGLPAPPPRPTIYDLKTNCTLEGVRVRNGREEAVISVVGSLEGRDNLKGRSLGNITGKITFDVADGFVSAAKIKIHQESEETIPGLGTFRDTFTQEIDLTRVAGNPNQLALAKPKEAPPLPPKDGPPKEGKDPVSGGAIANPPPNQFFNGDLTLRLLSFQKGGKLLGDVVWAPDGKSFYLLADDGLLQQIDVASGQTTQFADLGRVGANLAMSGEGLLVSVPSVNELWVLDPAKLAAIKKKIPVPGIRRVSAGNNSSLAFAGSDKGNFPIQAVDLKKGAVVKIHPKVASSLFRVSPDGKYYFAVGGIEQLHRYRIENENLIPEDVSYRIASNGQEICISPDSKYVCLGAAGGNGKGHPDHPPVGNYSTFIYPINNLKKPVTGYSAGGFPRHAGIDPKSGYLFAHNAGKPLLVYGFKSGDRALGSFDFIPLKGRPDVLEIAVSPLGSEAIVRLDKGIVHVKINKGAPGPVGRLGPNQPDRGRSDAGMTSLKDSGRQGGWFDAPQMRFDAAVSVRLTY